MILEDLLLSDVHVERSSTFLCDVNVDGASYKKHATTFSYKSSFPVEIDEDGDFVLCREVDHVTDRNQSLHIEHCMSTKLSHVGLQVWSASLFMCDYILTYKEKFVDAVVMEMGAGVGIVSVLLGMFAQKILTTDLPFALPFIEANTEKNKDLLTSDFQIIAWDWLSPPEPSTMSVDVKQAVDKIQIIVATDIVYDENLITAFFSNIEFLMKKDHQTSAIIALEKRINFSIQDLAVCSPAYDHFITCVNNLCGKSSESENPARSGKESCCHYKFSASRLETDFPQFFSYERNSYMEIWKILCSPEYCQEDG